MTVDAVIFDWGGTLTPWHDLDLLGSWRAYAEAYDRARADDLAATLLAGEEAAWTRAREEQASGTLDDLFRGAGVEPTGPRHAEALAAYLQFWEPHTLVDPDVPQMLAGLRAAGVGVGVLSNTLWPRSHHEAVFRRDGILDLIDGAVYSSEIAWTKPHPNAFRAALEAVGGPDPGRTVFVGDRLWDDVHGAQQVGMRTIHVPHSRIPAHQHGPVTGHPDATVQRLADVLPVVLGWGDTPTM
jgi:putative hydrolase of the HAD superfamily